MADEKKARKKRYANKAEAFKELANKRVPKAEKAIRMVGNLASPNYEFTKEQAEIVIKRLSDTVAAVKVRFAAPGKASETVEKLFN